LHRKIFLKKRKNLILFYLAEPVDSTQPAPTRTLWHNPRRPIWAWPPEAMVGTSPPPPSLGVRATPGTPSRAYKAAASSLECPSCSTCRLSSPAQRAIASRVDRRISVSPAVRRFCWPPEQTNVATSFTTLIRVRSSPSYRRRSAGTPLPVVRPSQPPKLRAERRRRLLTADSPRSPTTGGR
jgi:hypothetical protein